MFRDENHHQSSWETIHRRCATPETTAIDSSFTCFLHLQFGTLPALVAR